MPRASGLQGEGAAVELAAAVGRAVRPGCGCGRGRGPGGQVGVEGEDAARSGHQEREPGEEEDDVGARVIGTGVEADGEKEAEREQDAADGGDAGPETEEGAEADGQFAQGQDDAEGDGDVLEGTDEGVDGAGVGRFFQLGLERGRVVGVVELGIGQFLEAGEGEGEADEGPEGEQGPAGGGRGEGRAEPGASGRTVLLGSSSASPSPVRQPRRRPRRRSGAPAAYRGDPRTG